MAFALIVLAIGSVLAGYIGVPHALGGHNAARPRGWRRRSAAAGRRLARSPKPPAAAEAAAEGAEARDGEEARSS